MNQKSYFPKIKKLYQHMMKEIVASYPRKDTHFFDFVEIMSPIERVLWNEIKSYGFPMYPQFPVSNNFLDFADPILKIAIEADGKKYHDKSKDKIRDLNLGKEGWKIYRISGTDIWNKEESEDGLTILDSFLKKISRENYY